jgi:two-component system cell cycle response regulator
VDIPSAPPADRPRRILIVDDDSARRELFATVFGHEGYDVDLLADGTGLVAWVRERPPDLVLLDVMLPEISGFELCGDLRMMDDMRLTPIIMITSAFPDEASVVRGLLSGADDYMVTPSRLDELRARVRVQLRNRRDREMLQWAKAQRASLKSAAMSDSLTGLANRRAADQVLDVALGSGESVLAVLIDVDHFKQVNDTYGHSGGDAVLAQVARAIRSCTRGGDLAARYGGEEFLVIVRGAALEVAERIGERYRRAVRRVELPHGPDATAPSKPVTVSVGIAGNACNTGVDRSSLVAAADAALYEAKLAGRDRVVVCSNPVTGSRDRSGAGP